MASGQTANYQLNQWEAEDKVFRTEFNEDNQKIDAALGALAKAVPRIVTGTYTGDGAAEKAVTLGFQPALLVVTAQGYGPLELDTVQDNPLLRFAVAADGQGSSGVTLTATGFTAKQAQSSPLAGMVKICLNQLNVTYRYFAIKPLA